MGAAVEGYEGEIIPVDTVYRFFELFDLANVSKSELLSYLAKARLVRLTPPPKTYLEEKLAFALFHHPSLQRYWNDELNECDRRVLGSCLPRTWILDPSPVPGHAVVPGLTVNNCAVQSWADLKNLSKRERQLVLKPSGFSEFAWGSRGVVVGHDVSADEWAAALDHALASYPATVYVLQKYQPPARFSLPAFEAQGDGVELFEGRVRLNPYYFVNDGKVTLSTILATVCPVDKKKIHGMRDAVMTVCSPAGSSTVSPGLDRDDS